MAKNWDLLLFRLEWNYWVRHLENDLPECLWKRLLLVAKDDDIEIELSDLKVVSTHSSDDVLEDCSLLVEAMKVIDYCDATPVFMFRLLLIRRLNEFRNSWSSKGAVPQPKLQLRLVIVLEDYAVIRYSGRDSERIRFNKAAVLKVGSKQWFQRNGVTELWDTIHLGHRDFFVEMKYWFVSSISNNEEGHQPCVPNSKIGRSSDDRLLLTVR